MKKLIASISALALCFSLSPVAVASAHDYADATSAEGSFDESDATALVQEIDSAAPGEISEGSLIVTFKEGNKVDSALSAMSVADEPSSEVLAETPEGESIVQMKLADGVSVSDAVDQLAENRAVEDVQPNYIYQLVDTVQSTSGDEPFNFLESSASEWLVNDPYALNTTYTTRRTINEWYLDSINAQSGWALSRCDGAVTVAVMDTGINFDHQDLRGVIDRSAARQFYYSNWSTQTIQSARYNTSETEKEYAHGSHVAGILAAEAGNGFQFAGVSHNANIVPIKIFFDYYGDGARKVITNDALLIRAYEYIFDLIDGGRNDIRIINLSLGGDKVDRALYDVIERAKNDYGVLTVCASGNDNTSSAVYPADFDACLGVTSLTVSDSKASFSNYGSAKDIAAPGTYIWSTYAGSSTAVSSLSGTSMSAPMVSACAALMWAADPSLTVDEVKQIICSTSSPVSSSVPIGHGKLNVHGALEKVVAQKGNPVESSPYVSSAVSRITQGTDAADTAAAISRSTFGSSDYVVIARNDDFADSMSATGLAGILDAPVLLTSRDGLSASTAAEIQRLGSGTAYVIGGESALPSSSIYSGLRNSGISDIRRIAGYSATDTSLKCARELTSYKRSGSEALDKIIMCTPTSFEDSVSMSSFAYAYHVPILLQTEGASSLDRSLSSESMAFLSTYYPSATIFVPGGVNAVSRQSAEGVFGGNVERLTSGFTAYDTSNYIANYMVSHGYLKPTCVTVACGALDAKGVDGLAGGALAGKSKGVVLLLNGNSALGEVDYTVVDGFISANKSSITKVNALGGTFVMPESSLVSISNALATP